MVKIVALLFLLASSAYATTFSPCNGVAPPKSLDVVGCETEPCELVRGERCIGNVVFTATDTETLKARILATTNGITAEFPLPEPDACQALTAAECPLVDGQPVTYTIDMPVLQIYPKVSMVLQLDLIGDSGESLTCFTLKAKVVDP